MKVIEIKNVSKVFSDKKRTLTDLIFKNNTLSQGFKVISDVNLTIYNGECIGIIGRNGAGKSTLLKLIAGVLKCSTGSIDVNGKVVSLLELGSSFNHTFTGIENIYLYASIMGLSKAEISEILPLILDFADIGDYINYPLSTYSSGMVMRLAFSAAVHVKGDVFIVDEALSVGDQEFSEKCFLKMREVYNSGRTLIFVSHSLYQVETLCDRVIVMDKGLVCCDSTPNIAIKFYKTKINENKSKTKEFIINKTPDVELTNIEVYKNQLIYEQNTEYVTQQDDLRIKYIFSKNHISHDFFFATSLTSSSGAIVTSMALDVRCDHLNTAAQKVIELRIPDIPLLKGEYYLNCNAYKHNGEYRFLSIREFAMISVQQTCHTQGTVKIPSKWRIK